MPYVFAHPAAAVPLHRLLGRFAVPSALVIGSIAPDLWLIVPFVQRDQTHNLFAIVWFSLPIGLLLYAAFHLLLKEPLLALLPGTVATRLGSWTSRRLPNVSWLSVTVSIAFAAAVHLAWDAMTHGSFDVLESTVLVVRTHTFYLSQFLQHGSTLLGTLFLAWWLRRRLAATPNSPWPEPKARFAAAIITGLLVIWLAVFVVVTLAALPPSADANTLRTVLRAAGAISASALGLGVIAYCLLWRLALKRRHQGA